MGIRESFQENPPGEKDLNIHDIVIEEKKEQETLPFDPDTEITKEDYDAMGKYLKFLPYLAEQFHDYTEKNGPMLLDLTIRIIQQKGISRDELDKDFLEWVFHAIDTREWSANPPAFDVHEIAFLLSGDEKYALPFDRLSSMEEVKTQLEQYKRTNDWYRFAEKVTTLKLQFRHEAKEFNDLLDETMWEGMRDVLNKIRKVRQKREIEFNEAQGFASHAMRMTVLAAERIIIDEHGIKLVLPKKKFQP